jgi:hypothetical protein
LKNLIINNGDDVGVIGPWEWPGHDPAAFEAAVQRAEGIFVDVLLRLRAGGQRLSNKKGINYAPKLMVQTPEAKEMRLNETILAEAMRRLIERGVLIVAQIGSAHELRPGNGS